MTSFVNSRTPRSNQLLMAAILLFFSGCVILHLINVEVELAKAMQEFKTKYHNLRNMSTTRKEDILSGDQNKCHTPPLDDLSDFINYGKRNGKGGGAWSHLAELGGYHSEDESIFPYNEGSRIVCMDGITKGDCIVLSFGIGLDSTFDDDMVQVTNCSIFMFDPFFAEKYTNNTRGTQTFQLGLSDQRKAVQIGNFTSLVNRYEVILQTLNISNRTIDYLKIDIEGSELKVLRDIITTSPQLLDNVRQIGMEIHPIFYKKGQENVTNLERFGPFWEIMHELECKGFDLISFIPNLFSVCKFSFGGRNVSGCYDLVYVNTKSFGVETIFNS